MCAMPYTTTQMIPPSPTKPSDSYNLPNNEPTKCGKRLWDQSFETSWRRVAVPDVSKGRGATDMTACPWT